MSLRRFVFWAHLTTGCVAGLVIFVMSVTGVLLAFERPVTAWADGHAGLRHAPNAQRLSMGKLVEQVAASAGQAPTTVLMRSDMSRPVEAAFGRDRTLLLDPETGSVLGEASRSIRAFYASVEAWHRSLGGQGPNRQAGRALTGACNLAFLGLVCTGPLLWLPRKWSWPRLRSGLWFRTGLRGRARDWNWHNVIGIWMALPLAVVVLSGVVMSYPWANALLFHMAGSEPPAAAARARPPASQARWPETLDDLWARAQQQVPAWKSIGARVVQKPVPAVVFTIDTGDGGQPQKRSSLALASATGRALAWESFSTYSRGRQLRSWVRFAHTGEVWGGFGRILAALTAAGAAVLVGTGLLLAARRFLVRRRRSSEDRVLVSAERSM